MSRRFVLCVLALAIGGPTVGGCSDAFDPRVESDLAFAIFGTLDGRERTQRLRVQDVAVALDDVAEAPAPRVTSTGTPEGATVWRDSLIALAGGGTDRLYLADLDIRQGQTVRIEAERASDGARSSVTVRLPAPVASVVSVETSPGVVA